MEQPDYLGLLSHCLSIFQLGCGEREENVRARVHAQVYLCMYVEARGQSQVFFRYYSAPLRRTVLIPSDLKLTY